MSLFRYQIETDVEARELMDVILDFTSYPQVVSSVKSTEIVKQGPPVWEVIFSIEVIRKFEYTLRLELRNEHELHWSLVSGFFVKNNGFWILEPTQQGTHITYGVEMEMETYLPASIRNSLARHKLPKMVDGFIQEAKTRQLLQGIDLGDN